MSKPIKAPAANAAEAMIPKIISEKKQLQSDRFAEIDQRLSVLLERANKLEHTLNQMNEKNKNLEQVTEMEMSQEEVAEQANKVEDDVKKEEANIEENTGKDEDSLDSDFLTKLEAFNLDAADDNADEDNDILAQEFESLNLEQHDD